MRITWKRICAYMIDIIIITFLTQCLSSTTLFNKNLNKYQKYSKEYNEKYNNYIGFTYQLQKYYEDNKLTEKEYDKLTKKYKNYEEELNKYYKNNNLTGKNYTKLLKKISKDQEKDYYRLFYKIEKNSIPEIIIYLIITILYFVFFNNLTNGQTLGKKVTRLKIVNAENKTQKIPIKNYLIRTIPMYQTIYYITRLIGIFFLKQNNYVTLTTTVYYIVGVIDLVTVLLIIIRKDGRGLHDLLAKTKVILIDRNGNEIEKTN